MSTIQGVLSSVEERMDAPCGSETFQEERVGGGASRKNRKNVMAQAGRSKSGIWGPSHSVDSEDSSNHIRMKHSTLDNGNDRTASTKEESGSLSTPSPTRPADSLRVQKSALDRLYESAAAAVNVISPSTPSQQDPGIPREVGGEQEEASKELFPFINTDVVRQQTEAWALMFQDACRQCTPDERTYRNNIVSSPEPAVQASRSQETGLGISRMVPPGHEQQTSPLAKLFSSATRQRSTESSGTPASRRRQRHVEKQQRLKPSAPLPLDTLEVEQDELVLERTISELTMKSSYGEATAKLSDTRRMAYYAVGKHHKNASSKRVGNRRCYFTGKLILGGSPFYAGSVQQGLRTLVVFCLPSALGLPEGVDAQMSDMKRATSANSMATSKSGKSQSSGIVALPRLLKKELSLRRRHTSSAESTMNSMSRISSSDDTGMSYEEDYDPNWNLDRDYLLRVLPPPSQKLLNSMADMYPEQYQTLPVQVRSPNCWRLFVKFCFFSGLPIAEGEMHYKVRDEVVNEAYDGEEVTLSHEVLEAVNGDSAEILRLPNKKTFKYLRKHYTQQCGKLTEAVFRRESWEVALPEI